MNVDVDVHLFQTTVLCSISIKVVLKGGLGVLQKNFFTEICTKLGNSRPF